MKRTLFACLFLSVWSHTVSAQWTLAPEAGVNLTDVTSPDWESDTETDTRFFAGLNGQYWLSDRMAVGLGLQYSVKGYGIADDASPASLAARYHYLDFLPTFEFKPWPFLGIFAGFNTGIFLNDQYYDGDSWENSPFNDTVNQIDFGALAGAKAYWKNFYLKAHFNRSLTSIYEVTLTDENGQEIDNVKYFNQNIQIGLGYLIPLKKKG